MKGFFASVAREFKLIFRNGISIFMVAAPAILALVFILVFGAVNSSELQLAVDPSVSAAQEEKLLRIANVERFGDLATLEARVRETDAVGAASVPVAVWAAMSVAVGAAKTALPESRKAVMVRAGRLYFIR